MGTIDHLILKVNDLDQSIAFYRDIMGFELEGMNGPFTLFRVSPEFQLQLAPYGTSGLEHYAFALSRADFDSVFSRIQTANIPYGPAFNEVGKVAKVGRESGAKGFAPTIYFFDPSNHLIEIRTYDSE